MKTAAVRLLAVGAIAAVAACRTAGVTGPVEPAEYTSAGCDFAVTFPAAPRPADVTYGAADAAIYTGGTARMLYAACLPLADPSEVEAARVLAAVANAETLQGVSAMAVSTGAGPGYALIGRAEHDGRSFTQQYVLTPGPGSSLLAGVAVETAAWPPAEAEPFFRSVRRRAAGSVAPPVSR